jgi:hypothetical protein
MAVIVVDEAKLDNNKILRLVNGDITFCNEVCLFTKRGLSQSTNGFPLFSL